MRAFIHHIATAVPPFSFLQEEASRKMQEWCRDERQRRAVRVLYRKSGIERRHSVVTDFDGNGPGSFFQKGPDGLPRDRGTAFRNEIYARESRPLAIGLARRLLSECPGISPADVTHVVTASCTGFANPGIDFFLVRELGLPEACERYHLGFMGCYAAFPALRMAARFCEADPNAVVLVLCLELCTLHLQLREEDDFLLANSLFSDGAGAAVVGARPPADPARSYGILGFRSALVPEGEADMAWTIGDRGFDIALSSYVPKIIGTNLRALVEPSLAADGLALDAIGEWAIHPGGKSILDQSQESLGLLPEQLRSSREVLRGYGNMSSATILFVLEEVLRRGPTPSRNTVCAVAFGPGLTVEMATLQRLAPSRSSS